MADNQTPLSADSLRNIQEALTWYHLHSCDSRSAWAPSQTEPRSCDCGLTKIVTDLIATALQSERQRIADSLPEKKGHEQPTSWEAGFDDCLEAVRASLESPGASASEEER